MMMATLTQTLKTDYDASQTSKIDWFAYALLIISCLILFVPMALHWRGIGDFEAHNNLASLIASNPAELFAGTPHFLYHVFTGVPFALLPIFRVDTWGAIVMVMSYVATALILYRAVQYRAQRPLTRWASLGSIGLALAFLIVVPINIFTPENLYFGYFTNNVYHNPTINLMKPFAILLFLGLARLYDANWQPKPIAGWIIGYALLTILGLLAKPSFIIAVLPALGLVTLFKLVRQQTIHWGVLLGGIVLPAGGLLFYQIFVMTGAGSGGAIRIEPLRVFFEWTLHYDNNANVGLIWKLLLSIAFPLVVYILHWRRTRQQFLFNLGWLILGIALLYSYLLVDDTQIAAGDFIWSAQTAVVLLFVCALLTLVDAYQPIFTTNDGGLALRQLRQHWRLWLSLFVLGLHLFAGIHWYFMHITEPYIELIFRWW